MTAYYVPIYTRTTDGSVNAITFNSIPQNYSDLIIRVSARSVGANIGIQVYIRFNGDSTSSLYSSTRLYGTGASVSSDRVSNSTYAAGADSVGATATVSTFSNAEIIIPNYTSSLFKSYTTDSVDENNATTTYPIFLAGMWRNTSAINSITLGDFGGNAFAANSTFSLYGLKNS